LPQSDNAALRADVEREVCALEGLCADIERALVARDWDAFAGAMADSRRVTHAMENAMEAAAPARDAAFDAAIYGRAKRIYDIRENQVARLTSYNDAVGRRLRQIASVRSFARKLGGGSAAPRVAAIDDRR